ncbi:MAG TPA: hypothetical protein VGU90_04105 [Terriglobales bacterium]|nr:hypothetical protein [Terriglobales bacterium]
MNSGEIAFAIVVGVITALGVIVAALVSLLGTQEELRWNAALKIAEFRQAWINDLRDSMSAFQSIAIGPNAVNNPDLYRFGTKIELLMNRRDGRYDELNEAMYAFLRTNTMAERWACNPAFVTVSQNILKEEWEVLKRDLKSKQTKKTLSR